MSHSSPSSEGLDEGSDFHPNSEARTDAGITPSKHLLLDTITPDAKLRVLKVDPNNGRCLIQNCCKTRGLEFAHCYPRHLTKDSVSMTRLEYWWNMKFQSLNLDTRYNIFIADGTLHHMFDYPKKLPSWTLLPADEVIKKFWDTLKEGEDGERSAVRGQFPTFSVKALSTFFFFMDSTIMKEALFQYRFITLPQSKLRQCVITHQHTVTVDDTPPIDHFKVYAYPFNDYPALQSHLQPHFVILEAGRKLQELPAKHIPALLQRYPILTQVSDLYEAWTAALPETALRDPEFNPPTTEEHSDDEDGTKTTRGRFGSNRKRKGGEGSSPQSKRSKVVVTDKQTGTGPGEQERDAMDGKSSRISGDMLCEHYEVRKVPMAQRITTWLDTVQSSV